MPKEKPGDNKKKKICLVRVAHVSGCPGDPSRTARSSRAAWRGSRWRYPLRIALSYWFGMRRVRAVCAGAGGSVGENSKSQKGCIQTGYRRQGASGRPIIPGGRPRRPWDWSGKRVRCSCRVRIRRPLP